MFAFDLSRVYVSKIILLNSTIAADGNVKGDHFGRQQHTNQFFLWTGQKLSHLDESTLLIASKQFLASQFGLEVSKIKIWRTYMGDEKLTFLDPFINFHNFVFYQHFTHNEVTQTTLAFNFDSNVVRVFPISHSHAVKSEARSREIYLFVCPVKKNINIVMGSDVSVSNRRTAMQVGKHLMNMMGETLTCL